MSHGPQAADSAVPKSVMDHEVTGGVRAYAEALINVAAREGQVDAVLDELDEIRDDVLNAHPQLADLLLSPTLAQREKDRILVELFEGRALPIVARFLRVLNRHGRLNLLVPVARAARSLWNRRQNRIEVSVCSAAPLDETQQAALRERLGRMTAATPILHLHVDPALIGGLVLQIGDQIYDASVRSQLERMRRQLVEGKAYEIRSHIAQATVA